MPKFYFHIHDDMDVLYEEGTHLPDVAAALVEGLRAARALAAEQVLTGHLRLHHRIGIADEGGQVIYPVRFGDAVAVEGQVEPASFPISPPRSNQGEVRGQRVPG
jgi:hypothetical protein